MAGDGGRRRRAVRGTALASVLLVGLPLAGCSGVAGTAVAAPTRTTSAPAVDRSGPVLIFDERRVAAGVTQVLTDDPPDGYGLTGVRGVTCPRNQRVEVGATFDCAFTLDGRPSTVTIIVRSADGLYEVQPPNRPT
ncbi:DUF4333 domain-containing protein [Nakamurella sp.]|uniref:DUF4333 domain-containing protein n=1 Tax=Nakamurella sp. TaxID=1869182 RepID=UPI003B3A4244